MILRIFQNGGSTNMWQAKPQDWNPIGQTRIKYVDENGAHSYMYIPDNIVSNAYYGKNYNQLSKEQIQGMKDTLSSFSLSYDSPDFLERLRDPNLTSDTLKEIFTRTALSKYNDEYKAWAYGNPPEINPTGKKIVWPKSIDTDKSKFMSLYGTEKNVIDEVNRVSRINNLDPYELLAAYMMEAGSYTRADYERPNRPVNANFESNSWDAPELLSGNKIRPLNYDSNGINYIIRELGIWNGKDNNYTFNSLYKNLNRYSSPLKTLPSVGDMGQIEKMGAIVNKYGYDRMNPNQKGHVFHNPIKGDRQIQHSYYDMVSSQAARTKELYPNLFDENFNEYEDYDISMYFRGGKLKKINILGIPEILWNYTNYKTVRN